MQPSPADVIAQIRAAFPVEPIAFAGATAGGLDGGAYRAHVDGKTWAELDRAFLVNRNDALSFLAPHHLAAVLPVYLCSLVEDGTRTPLPDTLLLVLDRKSEKRFSEIWSALTAAQRGAVIAALDAFAAGASGQHAEAARAASARWQQHRSTSS